MLKRTLPFLSALALAAAVSTGSAQAMPLGASVGLAVQDAPATVQQVQWWGHRHHHGGYGWGHHHHHGGYGWGHHHHGWGHHHHYYRPSYYGWGHHHHHHHGHHHHY